MSTASTHEDRIRNTRVPEPILDLSAIDLDATAASHEDIQALIPHRGEMDLLDRIVWHDDAAVCGVATMEIRGDEFWVRGHFPEKPMLPGVLMVEAGAQLACYLHNKRKGAFQTAAFLRIEDAVFRRSVTVGEHMLILCKGIKHSDRRFISNIQGIVSDEVCFEARIVGIRINAD